MLARRAPVFIHRQTPGAKALGCCELCAQVVPPDPGGLPSQAGIAVPPQPLARAAAGGGGGSLLQLEGPPAGQSCAGPSSQQQQSQRRQTQSQQRPPQDGVAAQERQRLDQRRRAAEEYARAASHAAASPSMMAARQRQQPEQPASPSAGGQMPICQDPTSREAAASRPQAQGVSRGPAPRSQQPHATQGGGGGDCAAPVLQSLIGSSQHAKATQGAGRQRGPFAAAPISVAGGGGAPGRVPRPVFADATNAGAARGALPPPPQTCRPPSGQQHLTVQSSVGCRTDDEDILLDGLDDF